MNHELEDTVQSLLGFAIICFVVIMVMFGCFLFLSNKKSATIRKHHFIGMLTRFNPLEIFSLSLLTTRQIYFIWCLFRWKTTPAFLFVMILPGLLYNTLNRRFVNLFIDLINSTLLYIALMSKNIFYLYTIEVSAVWHVILFMILLMIFSLVYSLYFYFRNIGDIAKNNVNRISQRKKSPTVAN